MTHLRRPRPTGILLLGVLLIGASSACTDPPDAAAGEDAGARSPVPERLPPGSPRVPSARQEARPLRLDEIGYDRGSPDAPVKVVELSDFGCRFCRQFNQETYPTLHREYVETGRVQWKYVPFVSGMFPNALEAAIAAECAGEQGDFEAMRVRLYVDPQEWKGSAQPDSVFTRYAREVGLDVPRFRACVDGGWREDRVRMNIRLGREVGVRGTPTFLVDGFPIQGALPLEAFREILDLALRSSRGG